MKWIRPEDELPPQGKKILYLQKGDVYVVQRWGEYWLPIPFHDSQYSFHDSPELWAHIELPEPLKGKALIAIEGEKRLLDLDEVEMVHPELYKELIEAKMVFWEIK